MIFNSLGLKMVKNKKSAVTIQSKLPNVGTTIFSVMSALANKHDAINLSQGFPNFDCSEKLKSLVNEHMVKGHNQYAPMPGLPSLRHEIANKMERMYGVSRDSADEITVTVYPETVPIQFA